MTDKDFEILARMLNSSKDMIIDLHRLDSPYEAKQMSWLILVGLMETWRLKREVPM